MVRTRGREGRGGERDENTELKQQETSIQSFSFCSLSPSLSSPPTPQNRTILLAYLTAVQYGGFTVMPMAGGLLSDIFEVREGGREGGRERRQGGREGEVEIFDFC